MATVPVQSDDDMAAWSIPGLAPSSSTTVSARPGSATVVVGANGAGKSALGLHLDRTCTYPCITRVIAHRQLWMQRAGSNISPAARTDNSEWHQRRDREIESRYVDMDQSRRTDTILFDLLARENALNAEVARLAREGALDAPALAALPPSPLTVLNSVLRDAGLSIQIEVTESQNLDAVNASRMARYPLNEASDGEKAALLLAAQVLVSQEASILIIDEPERHLHRSISARLVVALLAQRRDCHFIILTHDLDIADALAVEGNAIYALVDSTWQGKDVTGWDLHLLPVTSTVLPDAARRSILGGRRKLLVVEGGTDSQDALLYGLLFPEYALSALGGGDQVSRAVAGLRDSQHLHWIQAAGIVDGDGRSEDEKTTLFNRGIRVLGVNEVENLYYLGVVLADAASRQASTFGADASVLVERAEAAGIAALKPPGVIGHLAEKMALSELRRRVLEALPADVAARGASVSLSLPSPLPTIKTNIETLIADGKYDDLVRMLPIRDSGFRQQVTKALKFASVGDYEASVRVRLAEDSALREAVGAEVGELPV